MDTSNDSFEIENHDHINIFPSTCLC